MTLPRLNPPRLRCHTCGIDLDWDYHDDHEPGCGGTCCRCDLPACPAHCGVCRQETVA